MPFNVLPETVAKISRLLPATLGMNAFRGLAFDAGPYFNVNASLFLLLIGGITAFGLSIYLFNWDSKNDTRKGHPIFALLVLMPYLAGIFLLGFGQ